MSRSLLVAAAVLMSASAARAELTVCSPITTLPYTISAQGNYCLDRNLSFGGSVGAGITIATDFVVLDLNGFKGGGGGGGTATKASGIYGLNRKNVVIRNGSLVAFARGVFLEDNTQNLDGSQAHLVEDIRALDNTYAGIQVMGRGNTVRRNRVSNTGGSTEPTLVGATGISLVGTGGRVLGNEVGLVLPGTGEGIGIRVASGNGGVVEQNVIANKTLAPLSWGLRVVSGTHVLLVRNRVATVDRGVIYEAGATGPYRGNVSIGTTTAYAGGTDAGNNR